MNIIRLYENMQHVEELPIDEFIRILKNMENLVIQEKLDGAQIWLGIDVDGEFYTSREGKRNGTERRYTPDQWPKIADFNQFRAAHIALQTKEADIKRIMQPGDTVEAEVLFGRQPNSVTYGAGGKSYIAFLRAVNGTAETVAEKLGDALLNKLADIQVELVDTVDGIKLSPNKKGVQFQFTTPGRINATKLKLEAAIEPKLKELVSFLQQGSKIEKYTNLELATLTLNSIPKKDREEIKNARAELLLVLQQQYKLPIKKALLAKIDFKSSMAPKDAKPEDAGMEGIILRDPHTGEQVKIVDTDVFTAINQFNQSIRNQIRSALNTTDPDASVESRGGLIGALRIQIAAALGNRELAKPSVVKNLFVSVKGNTPEETIENLTKSMHLPDFNALKKKVIALISNTDKELNDNLEAFKKDQDNYRLKLKNGTEVQLSKDAIKRTLLTFAEARQNIVQLFNDLKRTSTTVELLTVLYGSSAQAVHKPKISENLLLEKRRASHGEISLEEFEQKNTFVLVNSYMATVMMSMIIYHTGDVIGMRYLRDLKNHTLKTHDDDMSPLNHWGYAIWRANKPELKKHIMPAAVAEITSVTKKIPAPWWRFLHMDFSFDNAVVVDWDDHAKTLRRLIELLGLQTKTLNMLLDLSVRFNKLDPKEQKRALKTLLDYGRRFVPRAKLLSRIKIIKNQLETTEEPMVPGLLQKIAKLSEEGEADISQTAISTNAGAISSVPVKTIGGGKTVMMKRNKDPQFKRTIIKFKDPRK